MRLDPPPHVSNRPLRGNTQHLRQRERRHRLDDGCGAGGERQRHEQIGPAPADDVVNQVFGRGGQDEADDAVDEHQCQAEREPTLARQDQRTRLAPRRPGRELLFGRARGIGGTSRVGPAATSRLRSRHPKPAPQSARHMLILSRGALPLGLPDTRSRAPLRRRAPVAWLARGARSHSDCLGDHEIVRVEAIA